MPKRTDSNQAQIVAGLRSIPGVSVKDVHIVGGFCDIVVGHRGSDYKFEIKTKRGKLTRAQIAHRELWTGAPIYVIYNLNEALVIMGINT